VQTDYVFDKIDANGDQAIDMQEWMEKFQEDAMNPMQQLREIVARSNMTWDDLAYRLGKKVTGPPMPIKYFRECIMRLD
jgi:hypothetical protein